MGKRYIDPKARCPYYHSEDAQKIYCDGVQEGTAIHLAFGSKTDKKDYKQEFCKEEFGSCKIAGMMKKGEEGA